MADDIISLVGKFKSTIELQEYADKQYKALIAASKRITELEEQVEHLQKLLTSAVPLIEDSNVQRIIKTPEQAIIEAQIDILQNRALQKELTLEEIKILDLLIKNKRLLSEQPTTINGDKKTKKQLNEADLVLIASQPKPNNE